MGEFGKLAEQALGIGAGFIKRLHRGEGGGDIATHHIGEEIDQAPAVGEAEHLAQIFGFDFGMQAALGMGDRLVEQR